MRTFEYRLFMKKDQSHLLMQCLIESRKLYNEMLETVKAQYEDKGTFPTKYDLTARFKGCGGEHVPATTVQMLADRLSKSLKRFLAAPDIGIDVGLKSFLTDSEGNTVENPRFYRTSQKTLRRKQRMLCRRKKGSKRCRKVARSTAQTHLKIKRQRRDFHKHFVFGRGTAIRR